MHQPRTALARQIHGHLIVFSIAAAWSACAVIDDAGDECVGAKCDDPGDSGGECNDLRYGDGTCNLDISCEAPDIDCFVTFANDEEASEWFANIERMESRPSQGPPRTVLPGSDPRFSEMRALLDRGWSAYQQVEPVGALAAKRVGLVIVEDPSINAFVMPDLDLVRAGLTVMVHTGLLERNGSEAELMGLIMHELEHAVGLHVNPERREAIKRHYQVLPGQQEPFGFQQVDEQNAREAIDVLVRVGTEVGLNPHEALNNLPFPRSPFFEVLSLMHQTGSEANASACGNADAARALLGELLNETFRPLDQTLDLSPSDESNLAFITNEYAQSLLNECLAATDETLYEFMARQFGTTAGEIAASISAADRALIDGRHPFEGLTNVVESRYNLTRTVDELLVEGTGGGIETLRYFTTEEAADDVTVAILENAGLRPDGLGEFFLNFLMQPEEVQQCNEILARGEVPPYGVDLTDAHHANCWRVWHIREVAKGVANGKPASVERRASSDLTRALQALEKPSSYARPLMPSDMIPDCFGGSVRH